MEHAKEIQRLEKRDRYKSHFILIQLMGKLRFRRDLFAGFSLEG